MSQDKRESNHSPISPVDPKDSAWTKHLSSWGTFAAAAGAALAMSSNASAANIIMYSGVEDLVCSVPGASHHYWWFHTCAGFHPGATTAAGRSMMEWGKGAGMWILGSQQGVAGLRGVGFMIATSNNKYAERFLAGQNIVVGSHAQDSAVLLDAFEGGTWFNRYRITKGNWGPGTVSGFVGIKSTKTGDLGWMLVEVFAPGWEGYYPQQLEIISWAYNSTPGGAITAGETTAPTPEPNPAFGLLAAGAAGLLALRRRRAELAAKP